jgi:hypothetical protein
LIKFFELNFKNLKNLKNLKNFLMNDTPINAYKMYDFPWEVNQETLTYFFGGPHLFAALYRVYRGAYYGQGFQFCGNYPKHFKELLSHLNQLPLEVRRIILSKIWDNGRQYNVLCINRSELFLPLGLHFFYNFFW